jgi:hypothetical protein
MAKNRNNKTIFFTRRIFQILRVKKIVLFFTINFHKGALTKKTGKLFTNFVLQFMH